MVSAAFQGNYTRQPIMNAQKIDQMEARRRSEQAHNRNLLNYIEEGTKMTHSAKNEVKVGQQRRMNNMARVAAENMVAQNVSDMERQSRVDGLVSEQNTRLASEISGRNAERERMEREIQRVCDTSEELKDLERKLNIAYVNKERAAQHQESLLLRQLDAARESAIDDQMEYDRQLFIKKEMDKEDYRRDKMMEQKTVLQKQIMDRQVLAVEAREEAERDKEMVEAIVLKINEQDRMEIQEKNEKKEETRALVKYFQDEREKKMRRILAEQVAQEAEIKAYYQKLADRMAKEDAEKKAGEAAKKARWAAVVLQTKSQNQSKEEFNALRDMLWEEELEAKRIADDKQRKIKREEDKKQMMIENQKQLAAKRVMIEAQEAEENRLVDVMLRKFKDDEDQETAKQERRLDAKNTFIQNINGQKEERAKYYEIEKNKELAEKDYQGEMEEYRLRVVAEARKRLLQQHAANLKGFFPKGAITNDTEAQIIRDAADKTDHRGRRVGEPLTVTKQDGYPTAEQYTSLR